MSSQAQAMEATAARTARPRTVMYVEQNIDGTTGGSYRSLLFLLRGLDSQAYNKVVGFYREHELIEEYRKAGCRTMLLWYPKPFDFVTPMRALGAVGRLLAPLARLAQKVVNLVWVSASLFLRDIWLLLKERVDILHLNNGVTVGHEFLIAAKLLGRKCVISQRGIDPVPSWCTRITRHADHIISVSDAARQNLIDHGLPAGQITAIHNGIDFGQIRRQIKRDPATVRASIGLDPSVTVIGLAGMIRRWKGQLVLLRAMKKLRAIHPNAKALIMGGVADNNAEDKAYFEEVKAFIKENALEDSVMLLDYQPNAPEFLQIFDVMVHTAIDPEPFSRVVIEGMSLGCPIVASSTGGTPEAIDDGVSGFLVPADDSDALAEKVDLLIRDPKLRAALGEGARDKVRRRFLIEGHIERTCNVYDRILEGRA